MSTQRICLFPGTFDPITLGHVDIIERSLNLFDKFIIGIGHNAKKTPLFSPEDRLQWISDLFKDNPKVETILYEGLTIDCCKKVGANFILRGIRYVSDFEYEKSIADMNKSIEPSIETFFLTCSPEFSSVASTLIRDVYVNGGDVRKYLPEPVIKSLYPFEGSLK